jgi:hypothetical protein
VGASFLGSGPARRGVGHSRQDLALSGDSDIFRRLFEHVVETCIAAGVVGGEGLAVDASLIAADANKQRSIPGAEWNKACDPHSASRAVREYLATLDDAAFGAASEVMPKFVSPSDPAAQWTGAMRGPAFFAYADNYLVDVKFGIIMDVKATRAIRQAEVGAAKTMIERTEQRFQIKPAYLAADTAYGSADTLNWIVNQKKIAPHIPVIDKSKREDGTFSREDFRFDPERNIYLCPAGKVLRPLATSAVITRSGTRHRCLTAVLACSNQNAVQRCPRAGLCAMSTRRLATLLAPWRKPRLSSDRAAIASPSRCCLLISNASCGSGVFGYAAHAVRKMSLPSPQSRRIYVGLRSWSPDRHQRPIRVLRSQCRMSASQCHRSAKSGW